jgi:HK97 family phage prohead protease
MAPTVITDGPLVITRAAPEMEPVGDGWTVSGLAVPYGVETDVTDDGGTTFYAELFAPHAFARDVTKGGRWVNLMLGHEGDDGDRYLGRCVGMRETDAGLFTSFRINQTHPDAEAARSGELTKWSVSARVYRSRREHRDGRLIVHRESCGLSHVAATASPQYESAGVLVARDHVIVTNESPTPRLDALRAAGYGVGRADV